MQKVMILTSIGLLLFISMAAQEINKDSLSLVSRIEADQQKLSDLQSRLEQRMKSKEEAVAKAQRSADKNESAGDRLSDNPRSKKLARRADKQASDARRDARDARVAAERVDDLNKSIRGTKKRIAKNQARLNKYTRQANANSPTMDTTQQ